MGNIVAENIFPMDGVREVMASEQGLLTNDTGEALTVLRLTILGRIAETGKYKPWNPSNDDGSQYPIAVSLSEVDADVDGDYVLGILIKGRVSSTDIQIQGLPAGTGMTPALKDALRSNSIIVEMIIETAELDNQQV